MVLPDAVIISFQLFECGNFFCDPGFFRPVVTIEHTVVGPLCELVFGEKPDLPVLHGLHPIFFGNSGEGLRRVRFQHRLVHTEECAFLD